MIRNNETKRYSLHPGVPVMDGKYFFGVDLGKGAVKPVDAVGAAIVLAACAAVTGSRRRAEVAP